MNILFIDDEPNYRIPAIRSNVFPDLIFYPAHGHNMVDYYLNRSGIKFDLVCLDHDMPLMNGVDIAKMFLCERNIPVVIHSANTVGAERIIAILRDYSVPCMYLPITYTSGWIEKMIIWYGELKLEKIIDKVFIRV